MRTDIHTKRGYVSAYGLSLGIIDRKTRIGESGKTIYFDIVARGDEYSVDITNGDVRQRGDDGRFEGWYQTLSLSEARQVRDLAYRQPDYGMALAIVNLQWYNGRD